VSFKYIALTIDAFILVIDFRTALSTN